MVREKQSFGGETASQWSNDKARPSKIAEAQANGQWQQAQPLTAVTPEQVAELTVRLQVSPCAYENFTNLSPSVQKTYTCAYSHTKTPAGRPKRLAWLMDRVERNLPPM
ncbi:YdeI/OmpD-associated family protein [Enterococcus sp.]|uniref:YdeI/OmpD-associated family protein n=1 Tax=Enterococcus sp. TaxID=35783 RepID=UPI003C773430